LAVSAETAFAVLFYAAAPLPIRDGLPKQKDFPKEMGGSGVEMRE
jgi:hypothetical protein